MADTLYIVHRHGEHEGRWFDSFDAVTSHFNELSAEDPNATVSVYVVDSWDIDSADQLVPGRNLEPVEPADNPILCELCSSWHRTKDHCRPRW